MTFLIEILLDCVLLAFVLTIFKVIGLANVVWAFIVTLLLVPAMIGIFVVGVLLVHEIMSTPEDRAATRQRRHHRNFGL